MDNVELYEVACFVRGYRVYKDVWRAAVRELKCGSRSPVTVQCIVPPLLKKSKHIFDIFCGHCPNMRLYAMAYLSRSLLVFKILHRSTAKRTGMLLFKGKAKKIGKLGTGNLSTGKGYNYSVTAEHCFIVLVQISYI